MASGLRAHLHRHHLHDIGLKMPGKQTCVWRTQMTQLTRRHWPECQIAWCNEDDDADQHVHMTDQHVHLTARTNEMSHILFSSGNLNSNLHADQCRHVAN